MIFSVSVEVNGWNGWMCPRFITPSGAQLRNSLPCTWCICLGDGNCHLLLASLYQKGLGVERSIERVIEHNKAAAQAGECVCVCVCVCVCA